MIATAIALAQLWTPLFDGKSLAGWAQLNGTAKYSAEGGMIVGRTVVGSPNSFLCTKKMYGDFELQFEVWVDPALNSGVQIRSMSVPGYQEGRVHGYQVEIDPTERAFSGGIYDEARRGWLQDLSKNPAARKAFKIGKWNKYRVVARGDHLQTWVNGVPAADLHDSMTRWGFIALQVHASDKAGLTVKWRNLRIKDDGIPGMNPPKGGRWLLHEQRDTQNWTSERNPAGGFPWTWQDRGIVATAGKGDIVTKDKFGDCTLHVEFAVNDSGGTGQDNGNSGVYLMQSYEIQVLNSVPRGPLINECGAIYGVKAPDYAMALPAGQWQTYDIIFKAPKWRGADKISDAQISLWHNGTRVQDKVPVPGPTGAGQPESPLARALKLQEHGHPVRYRNIWIKPG